MKIYTDLLIPYSLAVGFVNLFLTTAITLILIVICWAVGDTLPWKLFIRSYIASYIIGYIILWVLNLKVIKE